MRKKKKKLRPQGKKKISTSLAAHNPLSVINEVITFGCACHEVSCGWSPESKRHPVLVPRGA